MLTICDTISDQHTNIKPIDVDVRVPEYFEHTCTCVHALCVHTRVYNCTMEYLNLYNIPLGHPMVSDILIPGKLA